MSLGFIQSLRLLSPLGWGRGGGILDIGVAPEMFSTLPQISLWCPNAEDGYASFVKVVGDRHSDKMTQRT